MVTDISSNLNDQKLIYAFINTLDITGQGNIYIQKRSSKHSWNSQTTPSTIII